MCRSRCAFPKPTPRAPLLAAAVANVAEAGSVFAALSEGGQVQMPLAKTFWSPSFGMLTDKFGVSWMVMAEG